MTERFKALLADDEPLLLQGLSSQLAELWPELDVVALAHSGREAVNAFEEHLPDICFLDVHMPGLSGVEAARFIGDRAHLVFVTAFDKYAVQAFERNAVDYLVKPVESERLAETVDRLKNRLTAHQRYPHPEALAVALSAHLNRGVTPEYLRWIRVSVGPQLRLISADELDYIRAEEKYTLLAWRDEWGVAHEGVVRTPLRELVPQLDPHRFAQIHRSAVVNLRSVSHVLREDQGTGVLYLKHRTETLPVSRAYMPLFRAT